LVGEVFESGTVEQVKAEIRKLPEETGLETLQPSGLGVTPLHLASGSNPNPDVIAALIQAGANIEFRDNLGRTPLMSEVSRVTKVLRV
jgi:ankyrin repeat protein